MEHKAFLFDYDAFERELAPILTKALDNENPAPILSFIEQNIDVLTDPYNGDSLDQDWKLMIEFGTVEEYGDYALTKYYQVQKDIGLGYGWEELDHLLEKISTQYKATLLGIPLGNKGKYFDPGKMGSYFQSKETVWQNLKLIQEYEQSNPCKNSLSRPVEKLLQLAMDEGKGLYVTF